MHNQSFLSVTTTRISIDYKRILTSFSAISAIIILNTTLSFFINPEEYILQFNLNDFLILVLIAIIFIPIQTSLEEYVFRGYLMQGLGILFNNKFLPLILTSLSFGFLHFYNPEIMKLGSVLLVHYVATGLFLGIITLMDDGIELALGFHAGNNLLIALIVTADWTVFQTTSIFKYIGEPDLINQSFFTMIIVYPILLLYFSRKYKWGSWKDKLTGKVN